MPAAELPTTVAAVVARLVSYHPEGDGYPANPVSVRLEGGFYWIEVAPSQYAEPGHGDTPQRYVMLPSGTVHRGWDLNSNTSHDAGLTRLAKAAR